HGLPFDFVLYSSYERQVAAHLRGEIDLAWNSPLAWIHTQRAAPDRARAIAMRDTDRDLTSVRSSSCSVRWTTDGACDSPASASTKRAPRTCPRFTPATSCSRARRARRRRVLRRSMGNASGARTTNHWRLGPGPATISA